EDGRLYPWISNELRLLSVLPLYFSFNPEQYLPLMNPNNPLKDFRNDVDGLAETLGMETNELVKWRLYDFIKKHVPVNSSSRS
ncbi:hypothetical protein NL376_27645, partial [Klebsiella pneumoniae]|nr:hypothetical protein [Klebsiella pneumoniae]